MMWFLWMTSSSSLSLSLSLSHTRARARLSIQWKRHQTQILIYCNPTLCLRNTTGLEPNGSLWGQIFLLLYKPDDGPFGLEHVAYSKQSIILQHISGCVWRCFYSVSVRCVWCVWCDVEEGRTFWRGRWRIFTLHKNTAYERTVLNYSPTQTSSNTASQSITQPPVTCIKYYSIPNLFSIPTLKYVGHLESKERSRIQPAQLFNFSWWVMWCVQ